MTPAPVHRLLGCSRAAGLVSMATLGLLWGAIVAFGQEAQPLAYRSSDQAEKVIGPTAGQNLQWSWDPSADLELPAFTSKRPLFARWLSPMAPGGSLHLALDPSVAGGPYDRLFLDTNADGRLADESPALAAKVTKSRRGQSVEFRQVALQLTGPGGTLAYHLDLRLRITGRDPPAIVATAAGWREGKVTIGGRVYPCVLVDTNANGAFNDMGASPDVIRLGDPSAPQPVPVAKYVHVRGTLYSLEVPPDGSFVKFVSVGPRNMGYLRMPADITRIRLGIRKGGVILEVHDGLVPVAAGEYRLEYWEQTRKDASGRVWVLQATAGRRPTVVQVVAGQGTDLDIGDPIKATMSIARLVRGRSIGDGIDGTGYIPMSIRNQYRFYNPRLTGRSGELIQLVCEGRTAAYPKLIATYLRGTGSGPRYDWRYYRGEEGLGYTWTVGREGRNRPAPPGAFVATLQYDTPFQIESQSYVLGQYRDTRPIMASPPPATQPASGFD